MGRPLLPLSINAEDQVQLEAWIKRPKTAIQRPSFRLMFPPFVFRYPFRAI